MSAGVIEYVRGIEPWADFAEQAILEAYGQEFGEDLVEKAVVIEPATATTSEKTVTMAQHLGKFLERHGKNRITRLGVFNAMDELRKKPGT